MLQYNPLYNVSYLLFNAIHLSFSQRLDSRAILIIGAKSSRRLTADLTMATTSEPSATQQELEQTLTDPRYLRGVALLKDKRLEEAVVAFEDLLRTMRGRGQGRLAGGRARVLRVRPRAAEPDGGHGQSVRRRRGGRGQRRGRRRRAGRARGRGRPGGRLGGHGARARHLLALPGRQGGGDAARARVHATGGLGAGERPVRAGQERLREGSAAAPEAAQGHQGRGHDAAGRSLLPAGHRLHLQRPRPTRRRRARRRPCPTRSSRTT